MKVINYYMNINFWKGSRHFLRMQEEHRFILINWINFEYKRCICFWRIDYNEKERENNARAEREKIGEPFWWIFDI